MVTHRSHDLTGNEGISLGLNVSDALVNMSPSIMCEFVFDLVLSYLLLNVCLVYF